MRVPLSMALVDNMLYIVSNSSVHKVKPPFGPYCTVFDPKAKSGCVPDWAEEVKVKRSGRGKRIPWGDEIEAWNLFFPDVIARSKYVAKLRKKRLLVATVSYIEQLCIDRPSFILNYPNTQPIRPFIFDIETETRGRFPNAEYNPIICIGIGLGNDEPIILSKYSKKSKDREILTEFQRIFEEYNPGVIVGYNNKSFDIPYLVKRYQKNGMDPGFLSRYHEEFEDRQHKKRRNWTAGRVIFDCYDHVAGDQTLFGIPNRRMKTVARWFGFENVVELEQQDMRNTYKLIGTPELNEYQKSDILVTQQLYNLYYPKAESLANTLGIPLSMVAKIYNSILSEIVCGRAMKKVGFIAVDDNRNRYHPWYSKELGESHFGREWIRFQAAIVFCNQPKTTFKKVYNADYSSFYPSIAMSAGISVETTRIRKFKPFTKSSNFQFNNEEGKLIVNIPDENFGLDIEVEIDTSQEGFIAEEERRYMESRLQLKAKETAAREAGNEVDAAQYLSQQHAYKILGNALIGSQGIKGAKYGDLAVAIAVVGLARWIISATIAHYGSSVISCDTDGLYLSEEPDTDSFIKVMNRTFEEKVGKKTHLKFSKKEYAEGYFYRAKNYVLRCLDGSYIYHGAVMKSSGHFPGYIRALKAVAEAKLIGDPVKSYQESSDISKWNIQDFIRRVSVGKELQEYESDTNLVSNLCNQYKYLNGVNPAVGEQLEFYVTTQDIYSERSQAFKRYMNGQLRKMPVNKGYYFTLSQMVDSKDQLCKRFYKEMLDKLIDIFDINIKRGGYIRKPIVEIERISNGIDRRNS